MARAEEADGEPNEDPRLANYARRPRVRAVRIPEDEKITLDGRLTAPGWSRAIPATEFFQQDPANGRPGTENTEVRFLYNNDNLHMGVENFDSDLSGMMGNQMLRDGFLPADDRFMRPGNDIFLVYTRNWRDDVLAGLNTRNRGPATKVTSIKRFLEAHENPGWMAGKKRRSRRACPG